jgi:alpha-glucosidase
MLTEGLVGYTFSCPDLIGGGDYISFLDNPKMDQDLVVRSAQIHALMPMMQFSVAPWRILDEAHLQAIKDAVKIRSKYTPLIMELAQKSAKTGAPIVSLMEYCFPGQGFEAIIDQFMLGDNILVAPVTGKTTNRQVVLPKGKWTDETGKTFKGGQTITIDVPLNRIPVFTLMK